MVLLINENGLESSVVIAPNDVIKEDKDFNKFMEIN